MQRVEEALDGLDPEGCDAILKALFALVFCTDAIHSHETGDSMTKKSGKPGSKAPGASEYSYARKRCVQLLGSVYSTGTGLAARMEKETR